MDQRLPARSEAPRPGPARGVVFGALAIWVVLLATSLATGNPWLSVSCLIYLAGLVLAGRLLRGDRIAWIGWIVFAAGLVLLARSGHGRSTLDALPVAINLGMAALFGHTLVAPRVPLIARVITAVEGAERLALPRVADYARQLTLAWTLLFLGQAALMGVLLWRGAADASTQTPSIGYLHVGGYLVPAVFMIVEYAFRRWHLRHIPHMSPQRFVRQLVAHWPRVLSELGGMSR